MAIFEVPLSRGLVALVDECDYNWISQFKWYAHNEDGRMYAYRRSGLTSWERMHRVIMNAPEGVQIDHRDNDGLNNQRTNLRMATGSQNMYNTRKRKDNQSGYKGVGWHKANGLWRARINVNRKRIFLGYFKSPVDAALAYDAAAVKYFGEFACTNQSLGLLKDNS